jgi:AmmeMemoRadiSam system protein A/AmmeMemoRadiSam system protein B
MTILGAYIVPHPPLIIPGVGRGEEEKIQNTILAYHQIAQEIHKHRPETIIFLTPHSVLYQDYFHISPGQAARGSFRDFGDPKTNIAVNYDQELVRVIEHLAIANDLAAGTLGEKNPQLDHGTLVPLYFIRQHWPEQDQDFQAIRVSVSGLSALEHYRLGKCLNEAAQKLDRKVVIVASGDLSHHLKEDGPYSYAAEGPIFDAMITEAMSNGDFMQFLQFDEGFCEAAGECGLRSFIVMAGALDRFSVTARLLSYEGPFGVGYAIAAFEPKEVNDDRRFDRFLIAQQKEEISRLRSQEDAYVSLARRSLESYIRSGKTQNRPLDLPEELASQKAGVFVSIKKDGRLRGCIGTIEPAQGCIADEIIRNAISAGTEDPRFEPVKGSELDSLIYSVDVLKSPEPVASITELDAKRYGVIVSKGRRRGLLLPNLEGVTRPEQQIEIALQKAGIPAGSDYQLERFEVVRHK